MSSHVECSVDGNVSPSTTKNLSLKKQQQFQGIGIVGLFGGPGDGKTTIVKAITGISTLTSKKEKAKSITINMGYTDARIYYNRKTHVFTVNPESSMLTPDDVLYRRYSFGDNPGHNLYMGTLITGASNIDFALFMVPSVITKEVTGSIVRDINPIGSQSHQHMKCFRQTGCHNLCICMSKTDQAKTALQVEQFHHRLDRFIDEIGLDDDTDPIMIPVSAVGSKTTNIDHVVKYLAHSYDTVSIQERVNRPFKMTTIRSFDVNKPGVALTEMEGGVFGGAIEAGFLETNDVICIVPGIITKVPNSETIKYMPLVTQVKKLTSDRVTLDVAIPGGFIGIGTTLDPNLTKGNAMVGQMLFKMVSDSLNDVMQSANCSVVTEFEASNFETLSDDVTFVPNKIYNFVCHGIAGTATCMAIGKDKYLFKAHMPVAMTENEKIVLMENKEGALQLLASGRMTSVTNPNIVMVAQPDMAQYIGKCTNQPKTTKLVIDDDLEYLDTAVDELEELYDTGTIISKLKFTNDTFGIDFVSADVEKTTTSVSLTNIATIFATFVADPVEDAQILHKIITQFAQFAQSKHEALNTQRVKFVIDDEFVLKYMNVRRTTKGLFASDFNKTIEAFVKEYFTCKSCGALGSMLCSKKMDKCKACGAIAAVRK